MRRRNNVPEPRRWLAALCLCATIGGRAQTASDRLTVPQVRVGQPGTVEALVSVVDERGAPVRGLGVANFTVSVDGRAAKEFTVKPVEETDRSISVVLVMDISGSMKGEKIREARSAAAMFVGNLGPRDYCSLLAFGNSATWLVEEFSQDKRTVQQHLEQLEATDTRTVLNEAFFRAAQKGDKAPTTHVAVVVMTDGRDTGSSISLDQAAREAQWRNVPVYALGFGDEIDHRALSQITTLTGGRFFLGTKVADLADFYSTLLKQLSSQYVLEFPAPGVAAGEHKLAIELHYRGLVVPRVRTFQIQAAVARREVARQPSQPAQPPERPGEEEEGASLLGIALWIAGVLVVAAIGYLVYRRLRQRPPAAPALERKCFYCGKPLAEGEDLYCATCSGAKQEPAPAEGTQPLAAAPTPTPAPAAGPWLEVLAGARRGERVALAEDRPLTIGRGSGQDLIVEGDRHMSREHAAISRNASGRFVLTNKSVNGSYVNNRRIEVPEVLQDGDRIGLGSEEPKLVFHDPGAAR